MKSDPTFSSKVFLFNEVWMRLDDQLFLQSGPLTERWRSFKLKPVFWGVSLLSLYHLHSLKGRCCSSPLSQRADATMFLSCSVWMNYERFNEVIRSVWWIVWIQFAGQRNVKVQLSFFLRCIFSSLVFWSKTNSGWLNMKPFPFLILLATEPTAGVSWSFVLVSLAARPCQVGFTGSGSAVF